MHQFLLSSRSFSAHGFVSSNPAERELKTREMLSAAISYQEKGKTPRTFSNNKRSLAQACMFQNSPGSYDLPKNAIIVMDGLKYPSMELLQWVLRNVASDGTWTITLLEVMPWLNIPRK